MNRTKATITTYDALAKAYQDKFMDLDLYDDTYDAFCSLMRQSSPSILEIGCGPGNITRYLLSKRPDFSILGIDLAPNMIKLARQNNPSAEFEVMDCRNIETIHTKFNGIVCGFCLPYLSKTESAQLISDAATLLKDDGLLYLSFIEDQYEKSGMETSSNGQYQMYVYCHESEYLLKALQDHLFETCSIIRKNYPKPNQQEAVHTIIIAKKKL